MWHWGLSSKFLSLLNSWGFLSSSPWGEQHMVLLFQECSWTEMQGGEGCCFGYFFISWHLSVVLWGRQLARDSPCPAMLLCFPMAPIPEHQPTHWGTGAEICIENSALSISADSSKICESHPNIFLLIGGAEDKPSRHQLAVVGVMLGYLVLLAMKHNANAVNVMDKLVMVLWMVPKYFWSSQGHDYWFLLFQV